MLELLIFTAAVIGTAAGGWIDLKTTEIPDEVPLFIGGSGLLVHLYVSLASASWTPILHSLGAGLFLLAIGYFLYYAGQWGEADALMLGSLGLLLPAPLFFFNMGSDLLFFSFLPPAALFLAFPLTLMFNVFLVGGAYSVAYSAVLAARNPSVLKRFRLELGKGKGQLALLSASYFVLAGGVYLLAALSLGVAVPALLYFSRIAAFFPAALAMLLLYKFARVIDKHAFRRRVKTSELRDGDVLAEPAKGLKGKLWVGLTKRQIARLRKTTKKVWIKEGVRFAPTFFLALLATAAWGNLFLRIVSLI